MRIALVSILFVGAVLASLFGVFSMIHPDGSAGHNWCLASIGGGGDCPAGGNSFEYIRIHLGALSGLTLFPFAPASAVFIIVSLLAAVLLASVPPAAALLPNFKFLFAANPWHTPKISEKIRIWLARHEKRDPYRVSNP